MDGLDLPTAMFFLAIVALLLVIFTVLAITLPRTPRVGILRFETTRGDRLFISLLGSAFIHLAWLGLVGPNLWWRSRLSWSTPSACSAASRGPGTGSCGDPAAAIRSDRLTVQ